jgi:hypothetical protein
MNCSNHPDRERVAFCQNCGKPLCQECSRTVGSAVFCEPCLAARLAGAGTPTSAHGGYPYGGVSSDQVNYVVDSVVPPHVPGAPSPALATILGFIPGVGAMYNGQYAKGVVHLIVFAILVSLANDVSTIFGIFIAGWIVYQAIEANHTARARLAGTPLPNPFGLNDLGERFGFGKAWPTPGSYNPSAPYIPEGTTPADPAAASTPYAASAPYSPPAAASTPPYTPPASGWSAPSESYNYGVPPVPPYSPFPVVDPNAPNVTNINRIPTGALWLIGLGVFFLIGNSGIFHFMIFRHFAPFLLIGFGVWLFIRKMTDTGASLQDDGTSGYRLRVFRALRGSIWVILVGVIFLLADLNILSWGRSWPLFIILAGLMTFLERAAYNNAAAATPYPYQQATPQPAPSATSTSIVPNTPKTTDTHDQEGR